MNPRTATIDNQSLAIGVLSITACVLFVGFLLISVQPRSAYAIGLNDRAGDYIMCTFQQTRSQEGLLVIDGAARRMALYNYNINNRVFQPVDRFPLERLPGAEVNVRRGANQQPAPGGG